MEVDRDDRGRTAIARLGTVENPWLEKEWYQQVTIHVAHEEEVSLWQSLLRRSVSRTVF